MVTKFYNYYH